MSNFSVANSTTPAGTAQVNTGSSYTLALAVAASTGNLTNPGVGIGPLRRGKLYDILIGTNTTPADTYIEFEVSRATLGTTVTWLGSVSSVSSAYELDTADGAFGAFVTMNGSAGSTAVAIRSVAAWYVAINQRASYRWVAAPGSEIVYAAVSSASVNGLMLSQRSASYTSTVTATVMVSEM
jgi:hypothetical protein